MIHSDALRKLSFLLLFAVIHEVIFFFSFSALKKTDAPSSGPSCATHSSQMHCTETNKEDMPYMNQTLLI